MQYLSFFLFFYRVSIEHDDPVPFNYFVFPFVLNGIILIFYLPARVHIYVGYEYKRIYGAILNIVKTRFDQRARKVNLTGKRRNVFTFDRKNQFPSLMKFQLVVSGLKSSHVPEYYIVGTYLAVVSLVERQE